jgi:hypothetical protein
MLTRLGGLLGDGSMWHDGLVVVAHVLVECMAFAVVAQVLPEVDCIASLLVVGWGVAQPLCGLLECSLLLLDAAERGHMEASAGLENATGCLWAVAMWCHCPAQVMC